MKTKLIAAAMCVALAGGATGCSSGSSDAEVGGGQFSATSTTTAAPETTSSTVVDDPRSEDEFAEVEAHNDEHEHDERTAEPDWGEGVLGDLNFADPLEVATSWGCALRAKPAGEGSDAWLLRLAGPLTAQGRAKLAALSSPADSTTQRSALVGSHLLDEGDGTRTWRVDCQAETLDATGRRIAYDSTTPVTVVMVKEGGRWLVDDFAWGGIELGGL